MSYMSSLTYVFFDSGASRRGDEIYIHAYTLQREAKFHMSLPNLAWNLCENCNN